MNKTAIKNFAIWARVNLIEAAKQRAYQYEITKDNITDAGADVVSGKPLTKDEKEQRRQLIDQINRKGFDQVMEEVAYTWFNRFIALRFMEVNGYLPTKIRVFTDSEGNFKPEILREALSVELPIDKSRVMELLEKQDNEELYKMLLIAQCNELSNGLPDMFEVISNYTELLFPNNLLKEDSIIGEMVNTIPEEDWTDAVQIIGWLYQYYNSELKDETFALLKKNVKITKERIPAATQLFTPDWIVRYMVENSLGRLWYEGHPNEDIKKEWKYYLDEAQQEPGVEEQLKAIREEYKTIKPEDIKVIDPCMGSGHILVYAFDVLMQIYTSAGWSERDAAESILENNLFGLDIDDRAGQLAYFAVMMKARKYSRRILTKNIRPKVYSIQESNNVKIEAWWRLGPEEDIARRLVQDLADAKEYGSILNLSVTTDELKALRKRLDDIEEMSDQGNLLDVIQSDEITRQLYPLVELAEVMVRKYDIVVTNPPYMGNGNMNGKLSDYIKEYFPNSKNDLFSCFIEKSYQLAYETGYTSLITMESWMFLSSFEKLRRMINNEKTIINMIHMPYLGKGGTSLGINFGTAAVITKNRKVAHYKTQFEYTVYYECNSDGVPLVFPTVNDRWKEAKQEDFDLIPGSPIAYWCNKRLLDVFSEEKKIGEICDVKIGMGTGKNEVFVRKWWEVINSKIDSSLTSSSMLPELSGRYVPYNKGGDYRLWYGNLNDILWFDQEGQAAMNETPGHRENDGFSRYFQKGITWTFISSAYFGVRSVPTGFAFDVAGSTLFVDDSLYFYILAFLSSSTCNYILKMLNPTMNYQAGNIKSLPIVFEDEMEVNQLSKDNVDIAQKDWNSYEFSRNFKSHPLI